MSRYTVFAIGAATSLLILSIIAFWFLSWS